MRTTRDQWAMEMVAATAKRSTCLRRNVGCVLLDVRGYILATGFNGVAAGQPHCNEWAEDVACNAMGFLNACPGANSPSGTNLDGCEAIHAEQNAVSMCRDIWLIDTCYVSCSPCMSCVKMLLNTGCRRIVFAEPYAHSGAGELWTRAGRSWEWFNAGAVDL